MIIGIDASQAFRPNPTGTERYAQEIIHHLLALSQATAHTWRLYTNTTPPDDTPPVLLDDIKKPNVRLRYLPGKRLWTHTTLAAEMTHDPPDVLFVPSHVIPFVLPPNRLPPCVVTIHDLGYHHFPEAHTRQQRLYLTLSTRWSAAVAKRVIAISHMTAADLQNRYGTSADKLRVIHEAGRTLPLPTDEELQSTHSRYNLNRPYALYVGTLQPRKNLARLIAAYGRLLAGDTPEWDLVLAGGTGWLHQPLHQQTEHLGIADHVHLPGYVPDTDLPALLRGATFFVFPSLFEGFGLPILEAQSIGVPIMSANTSAIPEVAGDAALLVDPTDVDAIAEAMLRLSQDASLRQQLIAAGYENVKRFSWEKAAQETLTVLEEAASTKT